MSWVVQYFLPGSVIAIMFAIGLELSLKDFSRILKMPRAALIGLGGQLLLLPALGFLLAFLVKENATLAMGIILLAACPGGATSNMVCYLARANTALSVSFTAITSVVSFITIPLFVNWGLNLFADSEASIQLPVLATMQRVFLLTLLPVIAGMTLQKIAPQRVRKVQPYLQRLSTLLLLIILVVIFTLNWQPLLDNFWSLAPAALAMTCVAGLSGYALAHLARLARADKFTISVEVGFQNIALAQLVASSILGRPEYGLLAAVYPFANWIPLLPWLLYFRRQNAKL
jgi:BASS family bile acid:Na+ symporter